MPTPTGNENISGALTTGQNICWNETHGYYLRDGSGQGCLNPDVDCSYFVGYCLQQNGFNVSPSWYTGSMITDLSNYQGFAHYLYDSSFVPQHGDIFVYDEGGGARGHTFFYAENVTGYTDPDGRSNATGMLARAKIEASSSRTSGYSYAAGDPGTQPGDVNNPATSGDYPRNGSGAYWEVWVHAFNTLASSSHTWHVFRWGGSPTPPHPINLLDAAIIGKRKRVLYERSDMRGGWKDYFFIRKKK